VLALRLFEKIVESWPLLFLISINFSSLHRYWLFDNVACIWCFVKLFSAPLLLYQQIMQFSEVFSQGRNQNFTKEPSIKDVRTKSRKIDPLSAICPHWLNPPCPCGHTINFEKSVFAPKSADVRVWRTPFPLVRTGQTSPTLTADALYGQPLRVRSLKKQICDAILWRLWNHVIANIL